MGGQSKGRSRRARREKHKRARGRKRETAFLEEFGPVAAGIGRNIDRLARYWAPTQSPEYAADRAREDMRAALAKAVERSRGIGIVHAVTGLRVHMALLSSIGAAEMAAAGLELLALALVGGGATATAVDEGELAYEPEQVRIHVIDALEAGSMVTLFSLDPTDQNSLIVFQTVEREISMRSGTYPHMLLDTLRKIFSDSSVDDDCLRVLGFTGTDAVAVMAAVRSQALRNLQERTDRMLQVRDSTAPLLEQWAQGVDEPDRATQVAVAQQIRDALEGLTTNVDTATVIDVGALATETGIATETIEAVLNAYTYEPIDLDVALESFFTGDNPLRTAPIVTDAAGQRMLVHDALALPAVREFIETQLKAAKRDAAYNKRRGIVAEDDALDLLAGVFPNADIYRGFEYFVPNPDATTSEATPDSYTKLVEGDGLLLVDDVAVIVEVKAAALTAKSRGGAAARLRGQLRDIVTNAAKQADRLRERIANDDRLRLRNGTYIDVSNVREIHTIAVSLEDLSGVSTATASLIDAGLLPSDTVPWTVSVHDLRIICEIVDRPSELLFYIRRRTDPDATRKFLAVDELDLYLYALERGLFVVPDPDKRAAEMPFPSQASVADRRRFAAQRPEIIESRTDPLDAWYATRTNPSAPAAAKPEMNVDSDLLALLDALAATGSPGWLGTAATLLEQSARSQHELARMPRDLARQGRLDGCQHMMTHLFGDTSGSLHVVVLATQAPEESKRSWPLKPELYLAAKKHQAGALRATMIIFDATGMTIEEVLFNNAVNAPNPSLDAIAAKLRPLASTPKTVPRPGRGKRSGGGRPRRAS